MKPALESMKYPRYLFDVDFDALPKQPAKPSEAELAALAAPTFTEELQRECNKAREEGRQEGLAQSNAGFEHRIAEILADIDSKFSTLDAAHRAANERVAKSAISLAAAIATKIAPEYARENGLAEIEAFVGQCLSNLFGETEIVIRVPEALAEELENRLPPLAKRHGLENGIRIVADPDMAPADCRINWTDGGAVRNGETLLAGIDTIVGKFLDHSEEQNIDTGIEADAGEVSGANDADAVTTEPAILQEAPTAQPQPAPSVKVTSENAVTEPGLTELPDSDPAAVGKSLPEKENEPEDPVTPAVASTPSDKLDAAEIAARTETPGVPTEQSTEKADDALPPALPGAVSADPAAMNTGGPVLPGAVAPDAPARK